MPAFAPFGQLATMPAMSSGARSTHASRTSQCPSSSPPQGTNSGQLAWGTSGIPAEPAPPAAPEAPELPPAPAPLVPSSPSWEAQPASPQSTTQARRRIQVRYHATDTRMRGDFRHFVLLSLVLAVG